MWGSRYFHHDFTSSDVYEFVSRIFESLFVTIRTSFLNKKINFIKCLHCFLFSALVTSRCYYFSFTITLSTFNLILLNKARTQSLCFYNVPLTIALWTILNVFRLISSRSSAIWAKSASSIFYFHITAIINIFERYFKFDCHCWSSSVLLSSTPIRVKK